VAQQVFSYILNDACKVSLYDSDVKGGAWMRSRLFSVFSRPTHELLGKTIGIFGFGAIGKQVANIANAFGMNILVCTRTPRPELDTVPVKYVDFDTLLASADYLTLHCPLNDGTKGLFDAKAFKKMKKGAYFINTARGAVIDEKALTDALNEDHLSGAAIDVLTTEPMQESCPLLGAKNITITPHVAWAPLETRQRVLETVIKNIETYLEGNPQNKVN
jgi:glycerate dehydrogenase